jgi:hypothetical protein
VKTVLTGEWNECANSNDYQASSSVGPFYHIWCNCDAVGKVEAKLVRYELADEKDTRPRCILAPEAPIGELGHPRKFSDPQLQILGAAEGRSFVIT